jgi:hypothetical protein
VAAAQQNQGGIALNLGGGATGGLMMAMPSSSPVSLLKRIDVQAGIGLTNGQRGQLEGVINAAPKPINVSVSRTSEGPGAPPSQDEIRQQIEEQLRKARGEQDDTLKSVLKPEQLQRLHEIWLQWRGPLALSDFRIAEEVRLTPETRDKIAAIVKEFDTLRDTIIRKHMQVQQDASPDGSQRRVMMRANFKDTLHNIFHIDRKAIEKAKKEAEDRVTAAMTSEETSRYREAMGKTMTFKLDETGNWPRVYH